MAPLLRRSGVGSLFVRTGSSSSSDEQVTTPRAARCKTMPRHECAKPLITKDFLSSPRVQSNARASVFVSATTTELINMEEQKGIDPTLAFERMSSSQIHFEQLRVSSMKSRLKRDSVTTCLMGLLRAECMMHRTSSTETLEDFQKLEVHTDATDNMPSMFHRRPSTEMHGDCQKVKVQMSQTIDPGLFNARSSLFLFSDVETYD
jgi:hypothetical protein